MRTQLDWRGLAVALGVLCSLSTATAAAEVQPYQANDFKGFHDILPPGTDGVGNAVELAAFIASCPPTVDQTCAGAPRPRHNNDQLAMYGDLVYAAPGLKDEDIGKYFKDSSFGVKEGDIERSYSPRPGVTILRDKGFGVPHIYGDTRADAMFGIGYASAEDRLFFLDVIRHTARAELSAFAGGNESNRSFDRGQWQVAPYTEADLERQIEEGKRRFGVRGQQVAADAESYAAGVNAYIAEAKLDATKMPGEYAAIGRPEGPEPWKTTDSIVGGSLIGGILGKGGGGELNSALILQEAQKRFGKRAGRAVWADFRNAENPEAPTTVRRKAFPYERPPRKPAPGSLAMPDAGSVKSVPVVKESSASASSSASRRPPIAPVRLPSASSNALLVSARESASGRPLMVAGPQTGYFTPQALMEQDVHAPTLDARGAAFAGLNLWVQLGRGRDYAWSATSAGQDVVDTFALDLCEPDGKPPTIESPNYMFRGQCLPIEILEHRNEWTPNAIDQTPAGGETLVAQRTKMGLVRARATIKGKPVLYTALRSSYMHEAESAGTLSDWNDPGKIKSARDFMRAASEFNFTFNWFYADDRDIAYVNSGANPVRARGVDPNFPVRGLKRFEWKGFDPETNSAEYTPPRQHPQVINQSFITSWNNKQARAYRAADDNFAFSSVYRNLPLDDRIRRGIRGKRKMTLARLIDAMEDAGTVDLRGDKVLPWILRALGKQGDPKLAAAISELNAWRRAGAHRRDSDRDGAYEHSNAIRIMDAWWPLLVKAQFEPVLGKDLFDRLEGILGLDNEPNNDGGHLGSAYQAGWYGQVQKDLRMILGAKVRGRYSRVYCGGGDLAKCRQALAGSLARALETKDELYKGDATCGRYDKDRDQWCFDAVAHTVAGGFSQPLIHWINRPTYQQANEIQGHRPR